MDDLKLSMYVSSAGMRAQGTRLRVISENLANAESTGSTPGSDPYRRKITTFKNQREPDLFINLIRVHRIVNDDSPFSIEYDPAHPAADQNGYVKVPNVNTLSEVMDMREANRSYEANLNAISMAKTMLSRTIELIR